MDFQSAMETFAEAWVAANAGQQNQALALTRAANAAAAAAAVNVKDSTSPTQLSNMIAVKKEHSPPPSHNPCSSTQMQTSGTTNSSIDVDTPIAKRRPSLQGVQDKLQQLQMQQHHQQQHQQQQQQQQLQPPQQLQQALEEPRSPRYPTNAAAVGVSSCGSAGSSGGRRSSDTNRTLSPTATVAALQQTTTPSSGTIMENYPTPSSQNVISTNKLGEYEENPHNTVGSITCLPPSALNAASAASHPQQSSGQSISEKLLCSPVAAAAVGLEQRLEFESAKLNAKSLPLHCIVESVHSLQASLSVDSRNPWKRRPNIETDSYVIVAAATPWSEIVQTALQRLGYTQETANTARGSLIIKNWKPISLEQIADNPVVPVSDIIGELISVVTLRIVILRSKSSPFGEIKDKLLKLLVLQSHGVLRSTGCPLDEVLLSKICRSSYQNTFAYTGGEVSEEICRKFDQWWSNQLSPQAAITPKMLPFMTAPPSVANDMDFPVGSAAVAAAAAAAAAAQAGLHAASGNVGPGNLTGIGVGASREAMLINDSSHHVGAGGISGNSATHHPNLMVHPAIHASMHHHHHQHSQYPSQKTRMRTSFDPEMELPKLQKWFHDNPHPSRQQIQTYVVQLNALESRRGRKPLDVNNVVYWFKNARAAQKRAEMRSGLGAMGALGHAMNGYLSQHGQLGHNSGSSAGSSNHQMMGGNMSNISLSHDYLKSPMSLKSEDIDTMSQHSDEIDEDASRPCSPQLPLSLTTHERNRNSPHDEDDDQNSAKRAKHLTIKEEGDSRDISNGSTNQLTQETSQEYKKQDNENTTDNVVVETRNDGENSNERPCMTSQAHNMSESNNNNINNNNNNNNNNTSTNSDSNRSRSNEIAPMLSNSPKQPLPKDEDEDLDMEDDDEDNENETSQLDDFRSPSPDLSNAMMQRKDLPFPMVPNSMFSQSFMYMSHYIPGFGQPGGAHPHAHHHAASAAGMQQNPLIGGSGLNLTNLSNEERRKRNRTFIDPVTEVPKLEQWFAMNTHPSHNLIMKYTEDLNTMPYRQKFPRLESKNVQFWFKNRRAKCKRLKMSLYDNQPCSQMSGINSFVHKYEERD